MSVFSLFLNILWIVFGGLWMAVGRVIAAVIMAITIIGLPWTRAAFNIASYTLLPFGQKAAIRRRLIKNWPARLKPASPKNASVMLSEADNDGLRHLARARSGGGRAKSIEF